MFGEHVPHMETHLSYAVCSTWVRVEYLAQAEKMPSTCHLEPDNIQKTMLILQNTCSSGSTSFFYLQLLWVAETYPKDAIRGPVSCFSQKWVNRWSARARDVSNTPSNLF